MSTNNDKQVEIKFNDDWQCYLYPTDDIDINIMTNISNNNDHYWISIQLPHIIAYKQSEINNVTINHEENSWYRKQFYWKDHNQNLNQRVYLIFESFNNYNSDENNDDSESIGIVEVWLNQIQIFSDSFLSPKTSIDLTEQLAYKDDLQQNTLVVHCINTTLSAYTYLLLSNDIDHAIKENNINQCPEKSITALGFRKNHALDYLVSFDDVDCRFDIVFNPKLKFPTKSKEKNLPDISINDGHDQTIEQIINNNDNNEDLYVPRLAILMVIVGTRGVVQPFVA
jgi:hypothetical protein